MLRRAIFPILLGLAGCGVLLALGFWQMQRLDWKQAVLAEAQARISDAPVALPAAPGPADKYLPVTVTGRFTGEELHVLTSTRAEGPGFLVIATFETEKGRRILIDRGFIPEAGKTTPRPGRAMTVTGNLHWPDDVNSSTPPPDPNRLIWYGRDVGPMAAAAGTEPVLVIARSDTGDGIRVTPLDTSAIRNDHWEYAVTWFSLAAVWAGMTVLLLWRITRKTI